MKRGSRRTGGRVPAAALRIHDVDGPSRAMLARTRGAGAHG